MMHEHIHINGWLYGKDQDAMQKQIACGLIFTKYLQKIEWRIVVFQSSR